MVESRLDKGTYPQQSQAVKQVFSRVADHHYLLLTEGDRIKITAEHPIWIQGKGWTPVSKVEPGDVVATIDGDANIYAVNRIDQPLQVYNFSVSQTPNYFVGNEGLWVHNAGPADCNPVPVNDLDNLKISDIAASTAKGMIGEAKVNKILTVKGYQQLGDNYVDHTQLGTKAELDGQWAKHVGQTGIDSVFKRLTPTVTTST